MVEEMAAANPSSMEEEDVVVEIEPSEEEEPTEAKAKAKLGVKPVARAKSATSSKTATASWNESVQACLARTGGNKMKAVALASRENPGLREKMVSEANRR
jgi:hypothetical protein